MADPELQIRRGGGGGGHPDPEIRGEGGKLFKPPGPQFSLKIRGGPPLDLSLKKEVATV